MIKAFMNTVKKIADNGIVNYLLWTVFFLFCLSLMFVFLLNQRGGEMPGFIYSQF